MQENETSKAAGVLFMELKAEAKTQKEGATAPAQSNGWITERIAQALKKSSVANAVVLEIENKLEGTMRERALRPAELGTLAKSLLEAKDEPPAKETSK